MSSQSFSDLVFLLQIHQRTLEVQAELSKVMHDPEHTASERDALIGALAELKQVERQAEPRNPEYALLVRFEENSA